jgi:quercetin dioxygenase-like cupin family protein
VKSFCFSLALCLIAVPCAAQSGNASPKVENVRAMKFVTLANIPSCFTASVEQGDPTTGPSTLMVKGSSGCAVPMHFHTPNEQVVIISGTARVEMKGDPSQVVSAGAFASAPAHHVHRFACVTTCRFYVISDGAFDIHYVDASGNEIPFEQAVKSTAKPATPSTRATH